MPTADQLRADWLPRAIDWGEIIPAIHRTGGSTYVFTQPVRSVKVLEIGGGGQVNTPITGDGTKPTGVNIVVRGEMLLPSGASEPYEDALLDAILELRDELDVTGGTSFEFYLHHDATNAVYRRLQSCTVSQFDWELTGREVVEYSFVVFTSNKTIDETAPA